jgi:hypothetical protein
MVVGQTARAPVESQHTRGLTIQLSQGQGRQPLRPEGAPPAAGVLRSQAALACDGGEEVAG